ncbi:hypothetical protein SLEP1_g22455 [Rubroshorea leprosula]|uniref:Gnk2-homologous domain-containing protein n=1 Tax=Rubroshorea leprosula TaxID=152421 RepID=A0AAV5JIL5_9ROSI|nr:hypothetical protein SLEP1_g22455 [Rubroshorea leprosula]
MTLAQKLELHLLLILTISSLTSLSNSATDTFVYGGCSQMKYAQGSPYEVGVDSLLTSLVNSAMYTTYNNFTIPGSSQQDTIYGLFQCRGDLSNNDCGRCVARAVSQVGTLCLDSTGGALQLEGCLVKYDKNAFLGVEDKTVVVKKCGPLISSDSDAVLGRRDAVLGYLATGDGTYKPYRVGGSGDVQAKAQCVQDLSFGECQDCLSEAVGQLKTLCGNARWGDMYLAKCYVRYSEGGDHSNGNQDHNNNDDEIEKTLAILIGLIAAVALIIIFVSFLSKACEKGKGGK